MALTRDGHREGCCCYVARGDPLTPAFGPVEHECSCCCIPEPGPSTGSDLPALPREIVARWVATSRSLLERIATGKAIMNRHRKVAAALIDDDGMTLLSVGLAALNRGVTDAEPDLQGGRAGPQLRLVPTGDERLGEHEGPAPDGVPGV